MKRNLWLAALVGVALTGCVNEESSPMAEQAQKMAFGSVLKTQSRASYMGEITGDYASNESFIVFSGSYKGDFKGWGNSSEEWKDFFDVNGEIASPQGTVWSTVKDHFWPSRGYALSFGAMSPADLDLGYTDDVTTAEIDESKQENYVSYDGDGLSIKKFKVADELDHQYDLMYATRLNNAQHTNYNYGFSPVILQFNHALSSIVFAAVKGSEDAVKNKTYTITGLRLEGSFISDGDFNENIKEEIADGTYKETSEPKWENLGESDNKTYEPANFQPVTVQTGRTIITQGESALLTIPQDVQDDMILYLSFKVEEDKDGETVTYTYTDYEIPLKSFTSGTETISAWALGTRYVYEVTFGGTPKITFKPEVEKWKDGGTYTFTVQ